MVYFWRHNATAASVNLAPPQLLIASAQHCSTLFPPSNPNAQNSFYARYYARLLLLWLLFARQKLVGYLTIDGKCDPQIRYFTVLRSSVLWAINHQCIEFLARFWQETVIFPYLITISQKNKIFWWSNKQDVFKNLTPNRIHLFSWISAISMIKWH